MQRRHPPNSRGSLRVGFWSQIWREKALWKQMFFPLAGFFNQRMGCSTHSLIILQFWTAGRNEWKIMRNEDRESVVGGEWGKGAVMECDEEIRTQGRGCWQLWRRAREGEWVLTAALIYAAIMSGVTGSRGSLMEKKLKGKAFHKFLMKHNNCWY